MHERGKRRFAPFAAARFRVIVFQKHLQGNGRITILIAGTVQESESAVPPVGLKVPEGLALIFKLTVIPAHEIFPRYQVTGIPDEEFRGWRKVR
jgi:hypothetical protein